MDERQFDVVFEDLRAKMQLFAGNLVAFREESRQGLEMLQKETHWMYEKLLELLDAHERQLGNHERRLTTLEQ